MEVVVPTAPNPTRTATQPTINTPQPQMMGAAFTQPVMGLQPGITAPNVNLNQMMRNQRKERLITAAGLDPSLVNTPIDGDRLKRMAREKLLAEKFGINPAQLTMPGQNGGQLFTQSLRKELAVPLDVDPNMVNGRDAFATMARTAALTELLGIDRAVAATPGITENELVTIAVDTHLASRLGITIRELRANVTPPDAVTPPMNVVPAQQPQGQQGNTNKMMKQRQLENLAARLNLEPSLLSVPGMDRDRLLTIAGDRYLAERFGIKTAMLSAPGMNRERMTQMAANNRIVKKLGLYGGSVAQTQNLTTVQIIRTAENRLLGVKLGLPASISEQPGMSQNRLMRLAGDRLLAARLGMN